MKSHQGLQVHALVFPAPSRPCAARAALREQALLLHLFRASYVCAIAWTALLVWLGIGSGPLGACLGFSGALEIVRRPRGASRASSAPTSVSGQLCLCHCLDRLVSLAGDWVRASRCMPWFLQRPRDRAPPARRFASKPAPTSVSGQLCLCHCLVRLGGSAGDWAGPPGACLKASGAFATVPIAPTETPRFRSRPETALHPSASQRSSPAPRRSQTHGSSAGNGTFPRPRLRCGSPARGRG